MANSIGDMYRVAAAMGEDKRRNSPFTALANAVSMIANAWAQNKQMQAQNSEKQQQSYIDNLLKLMQMNESANRINFQNAVNNQAVADGYLSGYNANQPVFGNGARIGKDDNANGSLKDIISAAENIYNGLYTPQKKLGDILDGQIKKPSAKVRLGNGGAVYDFSFSNAAEDNNDLKRAKLEAEIKAIEALAGQRKTVPKSRQDKSYQNAIKLLNSYEKIAKDEMLNEDVLRAARLYAQEIRGQLADYLNTPDEEKGTFGWNLPAYRLEEVKEPGLFGTNIRSKTKLKFVPMGNSGKDKDPLGLF